MSPLRLRPDIHVPWQALAAFAAAIYLLRSALRGWDLRPSLVDVLVFGGLAAILAARAWLTTRIHSEDESDLPAPGPHPG